MIRYTTQQAEALDHIIANDGILLIEAKAGSGKTFIAKQIVHELKPKNGIYTAFNKSIVEEGIQRFKGTNIQCKTFHALAYKYVKPSIPIEMLTYKTITEKIGYSEKRYVIDAINKFFVSASTCMDTYFENFFKDHNKSKQFIKLATKYVELMLDEKINPTFDFLLKYFHLSLYEKNITLKTDLVIFDEINDVTAVVLEIFKLIDAPKKVGLGETNQAIYQFLNLVNGFEELKDISTIKNLTKSYRCSEKIACRIESRMKEVLNPKFEFTGTDKPLENAQTLYCTATNAVAILKIADRIENNQSFKLLRNPSDIFAAPLAVITASKGKKPYQKQYSFLLDSYDEFNRQAEYKTFFKYLLNEVDDDEITNAVNLLIRFKNNNIDLFKLYKEVKNITPDPDYTISTVYTSKGLEFEKVIIADDLNTMFNKACNGELGEEKALISKRCYYVACSRAGKYLENALL